MKKVLSVSLFAMILGGCTVTASDNRLYAGYDRYSNTPVYEPYRYYRPTYSPNCFINREVHPNGVVINRRVCLR